MRISCRRSWNKIGKSQTKKTRLKKYSNSVKLNRGMFCEIDVYLDFVKMLKIIVFFEFKFFKKYNYYYF